MRVQVHPADDGGCGYYRLRWPAAALQHEGHDLTIGGQLDALRQAGPLGDRPIRVLVDADVVVLQRPMRRELVEIIPLLQRQGTAVVVEIDDDFHALPPGHPTRTDFAPTKNPERNWRWLMRACHQADLVTCTTPALAGRYAPHGRHAILPNCVPAAYLNIEHEPNEEVTAGWTGTPVTHIGDLDVLGPAITQFLDETPARFRAIGSERTLRDLHLAERPDVELVGWAPLTDFGPGGYPATVARLDIGIVPLLDNPFNAAKSWLKGLEYAALGVPFIASPVIEYRALASMGAGLLAGSPAEWAATLCSLARQPDIRAQLVAAGREAVAAFTYEQQAWRWWNAWAAAADNRTRSAA